MEASEGKIGTTVDRLILYCCHYDSQSGRYTPLVTHIVNLIAGGAGVVLGGLLVVLWIRERARRRRRVAVDART